MTANKIQVNYDKLANVSDDFVNYSDNLTNMLNRLDQQIDSLRAAWMGEAADAFFREWAEATRPRIVRVVDAHSEVTDTINRISQIFSQAEDEASSVFKQGARGVVKRAMVQGTLGVIQGFKQNTGAAQYDVQPKDGGAYYLQNNRLVKFEGGDADFVFVNGIMTDSDGFRNNLEALQKENPDMKIIGIYNKSGGFVDDTMQAIGDRIEGETGGWLRSNNDATRGLVDILRQDMADGNLDMQLQAHSQGGAIVAAALHQLKDNGVSAEQLKDLDITTYGSFGTDYPSGPNYRHIIHVGDPIPLIANLTNLITSPSETLSYVTSLDIKLRLPTSNDLINHSFNRYLDSTNGGGILRDIDNAVDMISDGASKIWDVIL